MEKENKGKQLTKLRSSINKVDGKIVDLLTERRRLSLKVIKEKERVKLPVREKERETEVINRIMSIAEKRKLDTLFVSRIFQEIIEDSVKLQQKFIKKADKQIKDNSEVKVALQGIEGSYSYLAAEKYFGKMGKGIALFSKNKFEEVVQSVESGEADFALLPIENTTSGGINEVYDLLLNTSLSITGEEIQKVDHCFASVKRVPVTKIKKVYAHYQAAAQCSKFLESLPGCSVEYFPDTAMSFRKIKEEGNPYYAAIAGEGAAKIFGLKVLKTNIANQRDNYTRFLIASREPVSVEKKLRSKTSLAMVIPNKAGSLADALSVFKKSKINLTRIESRPIQGNPWDEMFYLDFEGNFSPMEIQKVLIKISSHTRFVKILGSYTACEFERC